MSRATHSCAGTGGGVHLLGGALQLIDTRVTNNTASSARSGFII
jgi:hypothetical protein